MQRTAARYHGQGGTLEAERLQPAPELRVQPGADRHARFACDGFEHRPASGSGTGLAMHVLDAAIRPEDRPHPAHNPAHYPHVPGVDAGSMPRLEASVSVREPPNSGCPLPWV